MIINGSIQCAVHVKTHHFGKGAHSSQHRVHYTHWSEASKVPAAPIHWCRCTVSKMGGAGMFASLL